MAYSAGDTMIIVRGTTGGTEEWSNTWCVDRGVGDIQPIVDAFHAFYASLFTGPNTMYNLTASASQVRVVDLFTGLELDATWADIVGSAGDDAIPSECAVRISLSAGLNRHGGPFLPAPTRSSISVSGLLGDGARDDIVGAVENLWQALFDLEANLSLNSPTDEVLNGVLAIRVGQVFDAIRSRRKSISESYTAAVVPS